MPSKGYRRCIDCKTRCTSTRCARCYKASNADDTRIQATRLLIEAYAAGLATRNEEMTFDDYLGLENA